MCIWLTQDEVEEIARTLLDLMEGTTQHVTISSDLQLTTRNLPDTVSGDIFSLLLIFTYIP